MEKSTDAFPSAQKNELDCINAKKYISNSKYILSLIRNIELKNINDIPEIRDMIKEQEEKSMKSLLGYLRCKIEKLGLNKISIFDDEEFNFKETFLRAVALDSVEEIAIEKIPKLHSHYNSLYNFVNEGVSTNISTGNAFKLYTNYECIESGLEVINLDNDKLLMKSVDRILCANIYRSFSFYLKKDKFLYLKTMKSTDIKNTLIKFIMKEPNFNLNKFLEGDYKTLLSYHSWKEEHVFDGKRQFNVACLNLSMTVKLSIIYFILFKYRSLRMMYKRKHNELELGFFLLTENQMKLKYSNIFNLLKKFLSSRNKSIKTELIKEFDLKITRNIPKIGKSVVKVKRIMDEFFNIKRKVKNLVNREFYESNTSDDLFSSDDEYLINKRNKNESYSLKVIREMHADKLEKEHYEGVKNAESLESIKERQSKRIENIETIPGDNIVILKEKKNNEFKRMMLDMSMVPTCYSAMKGIKDYYLEHDESVVREFEDIEPFSENMDEKIRSDLIYNKYQILVDSGSQNLLDEHKRKLEIMKQEYEKKRIKRKIDYEFRVERHPNYKRRKFKYRLIEPSLKIKSIKYDYSVHEELTKESQSRIRIVKCRPIVPKRKIICSFDKISKDSIVIEDNIKKVVRSEPFITILDFHFFRKKSVLVKKTNPSIKCTLELETIYRKSFLSKPKKFMTVRSEVDDSPMTKSIFIKAKPPKPIIRELVIITTVEEKTEEKNKKKPRRNVFNGRVIEKDVFDFYEEDGTKIYSLQELGKVKFKNMRKNIYEKNLMIDMRKGVDYYEFDKDLFYENSTQWKGFFPFEDPDNEFSYSDVEGEGEVMNDEDMKEFFEDFYKKKEEEEEYEYQKDDDDSDNEEYY